jgi:hypothetical protein
MNEHNGYIQTKLRECLEKVIQLEQENKTLKIQVDKMQEKFNRELGNLSRLTDIEQQWKRLERNAVEILNQQRKKNLEYIKKKTIDYVEDRIIRRSEKAFDNLANQIHFTDIRDQSFQFAVSQALYDNKILTKEQMMIFLDNAEKIFKDVDKYGIEKTIKKYKIQSDRKFRQEEMRDFKRRYKL